MFKPITKWSWSIRNADSIPEIIRRAFKISLEEKAGAVHLVLPQDIAKQKSDIKPIKRTQELSRPKPAHNIDKEAAKMIVEAEQCFVILGNGVIRGNATACLRKFVEILGYVL